MAIKTTHTLSLLMPFWECSRRRVGLGNVHSCCYDYGTTESSVVIFRLHRYHFLTSPESGT